jgi:hypothetical protein
MGVRRVDGSPRNPKILPAVVVDCDGGSHAAWGLPRRDFWAERTRRGGAIKCRARGSDCVRESHELMLEHQSRCRGGCLFWGRRCLRGLTCGLQLSASEMERMVPVRERGRWAAGHKRGWAKSFSLGPFHVFFLFSSFFFFYFLIPFITFAFWLQFDSNQLLKFSKTQNIIAK